MRKIKILSFLILSISFLLMSLSFSNAETVKKFTVNGNDRISDETIIIFPLSSRVIKLIVKS